MLNRNKNGHSNKGLDKTARFVWSMNPLGRIRELTQELYPAGTRAGAQRIEQLEREKAGLAQDNRRLAKEHQGLEEEVKKLRKELETAQRATRRQAASFSRGTLKSHPKTPGHRVW